MTNDRSNKTTNDQNVTDAVTATNSVAPTVDDVLPVLPTQRGRKSSLAALYEAGRLQVETLLKEMNAKDRGNEQQTQTLASELKDATEEIERLRAELQNAYGHTEVIRLRQIEDEGAALIALAVVANAARLTPDKFANFTRGVSSEGKLYFRFTAGRFTFTIRPSASKVDVTYDQLAEPMTFDITVEGIVAKDQLALAYWLEKALSADVSRLPAELQKFFTKEDLLLRRAAIIAAEGPGLLFKEIAKRYAP